MPFLSEVAAQISDPLCCTLVVFQQMGTSTSVFQMPITQCRGFGFVLPQTRTGANR